MFKKKKNNCFVLLILKKIMVNNKLRKFMFAKIKTEKFIISKNITHF